MENGIIVSISYHMGKLRQSDMEGFEPQATHASNQLKNGHFTLQPQGSGRDNESLQYKSLNILDGKHFIQEIYTIYIKSILYIYYISIIKYIFHKDGKLYAILRILCYFEDIVNKLLFRQSNGTSMKYKVSKMFFQFFYIYSFLRESDRV